MTIEVRAHHLLCILTYAGKGYSKAFTHNYDLIVGRLNAGEAVRIIDGPDEICGPVMVVETEPHCLRPSVMDRDEKAARDLGTFFGREVRPGDEFALDREVIEQIRRAFAMGTIREACNDCEWSALCTSVAKADFDGTYFFPSSKITQSKDRE